MTQLTQAVRTAIRARFARSVAVIGEVSNFKAHGSGHWYFTLKDAASELGCVMWRSDNQRIRFRPEDGMELIARGEVDVYQKSGRYQLYVRGLEPRGTGDLELAFRQLHERLTREGLFEARHKQSIRRIPEHIGLITSASGAAIEDVRRTLDRRFPCVRVTLQAVTVQGDGAAESVARAIQHLNRLDDLDTILLTRGGGSIEDLWAFNEEAVARAIFESRIPIITGIGHETDLTIADLVADLRAATPTAAAEQAVPSREDLLATLEQIARRAARAIDGRSTLTRRTLDALAQREPLRAPLNAIRGHRQHIDHHSTLLHQAMDQHLARPRQQLSRFELVLQTIEPRRLLGVSESRLQAVVQRLVTAALGLLQGKRRQADTLRARLETRSPINDIRVRRQQLSAVEHALQRSASTTLERARQRMDSVARHLQAVSHQRTLQRGYTITTLCDDGRLITRADQVRNGQRVTTMTAQGAFESEVRDTETDQMELFG